MMGKGKQKIVAWLEGEIMGSQRSSRLSRKLSVKQMEILSVVYKSCINDNGQVILLYRFSL